MGRNEWAHPGYHPGSTDSECGGAGEPTRQSDVFARSWWTRTLENAVGLTGCSFAGLLMGVIGLAGAGVGWLARVR